jgi:nucleotide-binding universal stress UspA family protein
LAQGLLLHQGTEEPSRAEAHDTMTIVFGTDFSPGADAAAAAAASLASRLGESLQLVHVLTEFGKEAFASRAIESSFADVRKRLERHAAELAWTSHAVVEAVLRPGPAHEELAAVAEEQRASLLVVAAFGRATSRYRWLVGSTAERVSQVATTPVMVVRDAMRIRRWLDGCHPLRVLIGVEPQTVTSRAALSWSIGLARVAPCEHMIGQVVAPAAEHARLGIPVPRPPDHLGSDAEAVVRRDLEGLVRAVSAPPTTKILVEVGSIGPSDGLVDLAMQHSVDLLVVGTSQRSLVGRLWQGSVARAVIQAAACNIVCVPPAAEDARRDLRPPPSFRRVVVATDLSTLGDEAVPLAYALVADRGAVHLVTVAAMADEAQQQVLRERLLTRVPPEARTRGITTAAEAILEDDVAAAICGLADRLGADAVCMATRSRSGLSRALLGSAAAAVVRRSRRPVLLVPVNDP